MRTVLIAAICCVASQIFVAVTKCYLRTCENLRAGTAGCEMESESTDPRTFDQKKTFAIFLS